MWVLLALIAAVMAAQPLVFQSGQAGADVDSGPFWAVYNFTTGVLQRVQIEGTGPEDPFMEFAYLAGNGRVYAHVYWNKNSSFAVMVFDALSGRVLQSRPVPPRPIWWANCGIFYDERSNSAFLLGCCYGAYTGVVVSKIDMATGAASDVARLPTVGQPWMLSAPVHDRHDPALFRFLMLQRAPHMAAIATFSVAPSFNLSIVTPQRALDYATTPLLQTPQGWYTVLFNDAITAEDFYALDLATGRAQKLWQFPAQYSSGVWSPVCNGTHVISLLLSPSLSLCAIEVATGRTASCTAFSAPWLAPDFQIETTFLLQ